jgi:hypothetical protein
MLRRDARRVRGRAREKAIWKPAVDGVSPFERVAAATQSEDKSDHIGKVVIKVA